jgi:hypothetical protein
MGESDYQGITESIMTELQHKHNLRPTDKNTTIFPAKKVLSRSKTNDTGQLSTETQDAKKNS